MLLLLLMGSLCDRGAAADTLSGYLCGGATGSGASWTSCSAWWNNRTSGICYYTYGVVTCVNGRITGGNLTSL